MNLRSNKDFNGKQEQIQNVHGQMCGHKSCFTHTCCRKTNFPAVYLMICLLKRYLNTDIPEGTIHWSYMSFYMPP